MKKLAVLPLCLGCIFAVSTSHAMDLKQSKITQVVNDVQIISAADQKEKSAAVNDFFNMPDILRTGPASRAELVAADETVTRVGANTIFSFDPVNRTIDLKQGSLLFHSPHGKGGGTIHTGSATASVLGTTLIITTTPSGGLKVLDLEGQVEVNFLNGLKQSLAPGQMTFVLPGGNQLAPIIVFRLDDVTKNGHLVNGFNQPLSSLPLIEQQIEKQLKLIESGKFSDTGLDVGDDANAQQVQVLDVNTLESALDHSYVNPTGVDAALGADATINQSSLTSSQIPTPPGRIFLDAPFLLPDNNFFAGQPFMGFAAKNIFINTSGVRAGTLTVDMSPYASHSEFDMVAANNFNIEGSVTFGGFSAQDSIYFYLVAGNQFIISPGVTVTANIANLEMSSPGAFTLSDASLMNNLGNTALAFGSDVSVKNNSYLHAFGDLSITTTGNLSITGSSILADSIFLVPTGGKLTIDSSTLVLNTFGIFRAGTSFTLNNSVINANPGSGAVSFNSGSGSVNITQSSIAAQYLSVNSGDGILLDGSGNTFTTSGAGASANFVAVNTIAINNTDFTPFATVNMAANTINLLNDAFDGTVNLKSLYGLWNNGSVVPGDVNNLGGNTYHGSAISAPNGFSGTIPNTGITISTR